jgi:hypothetical protein
MKWKEQEGLSHAEIVQRWKDETGKKVTKDAVAKAIQRLRKKKLTQQY